MKQQGANIVARNAVDLLIDHLEKTAVGLTEQARAFTMHANRKMTGLYSSPPFIDYQKRSPIVDQV